MKIAEEVAKELMHYLDGEINNGVLMASTEDGDESEVWGMESACYRTSGKNTGNLEIFLSNGAKRRGLSLKFEITDDQALPDEVCRYCGGKCPSEPAGSENLCDGFAGNIDTLYPDK
jgi:hypothetical protein